MKYHVYFYCFVLVFRRLCEVKVSKPDKNLKRLKNILWSQKHGKKTISGTSFRVYVNTRCLLYARILAKLFPRYLFPELMICLLISKELNAFNSKFNYWNQFFDTKPIRLFILYLERRCSEQIDETK